MKIQSVKECFKRLMVKGRGLYVTAMAFMFTVALPGLASAQSTGLDTLGEQAGDKIDGLASQLVGPGLAVVGIAVGVATVAVVLRLTKKA